MDNQLQVINEQVVLDQQFKIYGTIDEPLFLAKDVAAWIQYSKTSQGYYNVSMMLKTIDEDEKVTINNVDSEGKPHQNWFLTENGLYEVLMQSRKPIAKQFKKEIKQILKELRLKGTYSLKPLSSTQMFSLQAKINEENEKRFEALEAEVKQNRRVADQFSDVQAQATIDLQRDVDNLRNQIDMNYGPPIRQQITHYVKHILIHKLQADNENATYQDAWNYFYSQVSIKYGMDLHTIVQFKRDGMIRAGATKTEANKYNALSFIEDNPILTKICRKIMDGDYNE